MKGLIVAAAVTAALALGSCSGNGAAEQKSPAHGYENDVIAAIMQRRSIRQYTDEPVDRKQLQLIAECGINAPNAMNAQQWEVRIVDDKEWIDGMTQLQLSQMEPQQAEALRNDPSYKNMFRNGTALIVVAVKPGGMTAIDAGLMGENMMLAAHSLGLGTCCLGSPARFLASPVAAEYLAKLGFSEGYAVQYILAVGHPAESPQAKPRNASVIRFI